VGGRVLRTRIELDLNSTLIAIPETEIVQGVSTGITEPSQVAIT
jgi:hypothetical protein